jgi:hypothetical protein
METINICAFFEHEKFGFSLIVVRFTSTEIERTSLHFYVGLLHQKLPSKFGYIPVFLLLHKIKVKYKIVSVLN